MKLIQLESPFAGTARNGLTAEQDRKVNINYLRAALRDSLLRGEAPFASHAIYTQYGVLDDNDPIERGMGIEAGLAWGKVAALTVVYVDRGISSGMRMGITRAYKQNRLVTVRSIDKQFDHRRVSSEHELRDVIFRLCVCGHFVGAHNSSGICQDLHPSVCPQCKGSGREWENGDMSDCQEARCVRGVIQSPCTCMKIEALFQSNVTVDVKGPLGSQE